MQCSEERWRAQRTVAETPSSSTLAPRQVALDEDDAEIDWMLSTHEGIHKLIGALPPPSSSVFNSYFCALLLS